MSGYRLFIDIPINQSEEDAVLTSRRIIGLLETESSRIKCEGVDAVNFRLGHDSDRQKSNYLEINNNGHCSNKKTKMPL